MAVYCDDCGTAGSGNDEAGYTSGGGWKCATHRPKVEAPKPARREGAALYNAKGERIRGVKNLAWLLRNWKTARSVKVSAVRFKAGAGLAECRLIVTMDAANTPGNAARYETDWGSARLCWDWLRRPVLSGLPLTWGTLPVSIIGDSSEYPGHPND